MAEARTNLPRGRPSGDGRPSPEEILFHRARRPKPSKFHLHPELAGLVSDGTEGWFRLGRLLSDGSHGSVGGGGSSGRSGSGGCNNRPVESAILRDLGLRDSAASSLFLGMSPGCERLHSIDLSGNRFGAEAVRAYMTTFCRNSHNLMDFKVGENVNFDSTCFGLLISAMDGGVLSNLRLRGAGISDIGALDEVDLPRLRLLDLDRNDVREIPDSLGRFERLEHLWLEGNRLSTTGHASMARLLRNEGGTSRLKNVDLTYTGMRDGDAVALAESLRGNGTLERIRLEGNKLGENSHRAFLKVLCDVSSVSNTLNSNHTLRNLELPRSIDPSVMELFYRIGIATGMNKSCAHDILAAGRAKVIAAQLHGHERRELCRLQQIDYVDYGYVLLQIETPLLPEVLSIVGAEHGLNELYLALGAIVPELASAVDRAGVLRQNVEGCRARMAALRAVYVRQTDAIREEMDRMNEELILIELGSGMAAR